MTYNKKNLGLTLLETIVSVAILIVLITGSIYYYVEKTKKTKAEVFGAEVVKYLKITDEKVAISGYREDYWPIKEATDFDAFKNFMYSNYNAVSGSCNNGGWTPVKDRSNTESDEYKERTATEKGKLTDKNKTSFFDCSYFSSDKFFFGMIPTAYVNIDEDTKKINTVDFIFRFSNKKHSHDDFVNIKRSIDMMRSQDPSNISGQHLYAFVSTDNINRELKALECLNLEEKCAIKASFRRNGQNDYVRTDGLSPMDNSVVTFKMHDYILGQDGRNNVAHGVVKNCDKWTFNEASNSWSKNSTIKCGIGIYENNLVASLIDGEVTGKGFYLNQQCNSFTLNNTSSPTGAMAGVPQNFIDSYGQVLTKDSKLLPCGQFEENNEYYVLNNEIHADEVNIGGPRYNENDGDSKISGDAIDSALIVAPSEEMIKEDYNAKLDYDANPKSLSAEDQLLNPSKGDFRKPSTSSVVRISDPSISSTENAIQKLNTKNMTIYEDLIVNKDSALTPEEVFVTGELEVLNSYSVNQVQEINSNPFMTTEQKEAAKRKLEYSTIGGSAEVAGNLDSGNIVVGSDKLFNYDEEKKQYSFKNNPENIATMNNKTSGSIVEIASKINEITAAKDINVNNIAESRNKLNANTLQFRANLDVYSGAICEDQGKMAANSVYELFICQNGKWENFISDGGISAFNSETCPVGWRAFTEADGRSLIGTGYFDTIHAGITLYKTGDKGGEAMHKLTVEELPSHTHNRPIVQHICSACHYNLGLAKIASGTSYWSQNVQSAATGGDQPHNNMSPYQAVKFCIKGNDELFDYVESNAPNPTDVWVEYSVEEGDFENYGPKYGCYFTTQVDNISDPANPKEYSVEVCNQDQRKTNKEREINPRTSQVRYTGMETYEYQTIITQEAWATYDPFYTSCTNVGDNYNCGAWNKDEDDYDYGTLFTKERSCSQKRIRYVQIRERNWINGQIRVVGTKEEECNPPATVKEYQDSTGTHVERLILPITFGKVNTSNGGHRLELSGAYNINSNTGDDAGTVGTPADKNNLSIMIKGRKQERSGSGATFSCEISLYAVNGLTANLNGSTGSSFSFLEGYTKVRFYNDKNAQVGATVTVGSTSAYGNYAYKLSTGDVCSAVDSMYNGTNTIKYLVIDNK